jgi:8-oxo-dGTP pyrophosphatase MutT (NUDIX family)
MAPAAGRGGNQVIPRPPGARPGAPPPWAVLGDAERAVSLDRVVAAMAAAPPPKRSLLEDSGVRASAVLCALFADDQGRATVVLTRRAQHLRSHRGEVSFPGGGQDPADEDLLATALRESHEEIGLDASGMKVLGELDHLRTVSGNSYIAPYVVTLPRQPALVPNPGEVERILMVPLAELLGDGVYYEEEWGIPGLLRPIMFFDVEGDTIWGATAAMLRNLLELVLAVSPR